MPIDLVEEPGTISDVHRPILRGVRRITVYDPYGPDDYLQQPEFADRLAAWNRGEFHYVGLQLQAEIDIRISDDCAVTIHIESPGIWGVESDAGEEHFASIAEDEGRVLYAMLTALGIAVPAREELLTDPSHRSN